MSDLVKRLRASTCHGTGGKQPHSLVETEILSEAADAIEALTARAEAAEKALDDMTGQRDHLERWSDINSAVAKGHADLVDVWKVRSDPPPTTAQIMAHPKVRALVAALNECRDELDEYSRQEYPGDHPVHERYRKRDYDSNTARLALAALEPKP